MQMIQRAKRLGAMPLLNDVLRIQVAVARRGWIVLHYRWVDGEMPLPAPRVIGL